LEPAAADGRRASVLYGRRARAQNAGENVLYNILSVMDFYTKRRHF